MARVFVRLKLRLTLNVLRSSWVVLVMYLLTALFAVQLAGLGFIGLASLRWAAPDVLEPLSHTDILSLAFSVLTVMWAAGPLLAMGQDDSLNPASLILLPLTRSDMVRGMLASSFVGIGPLAAVLGLSGLLIGFTRGPVSVLVVPLAAVGVVAFAVALTRTVGASLDRVLLSRRGRDLTLVLVVALSGAVYLGIFAVGSISRRTLADAADVLRWTPPGWAAHAIGAADRAPITAVGLLIALAVAVAVTATAWIGLLGRVQTTADGGTTPRGSARRSRSAAASSPPAAGAGSSISRLDRWTGRLRDQTVAAEWARGLRYLWRLPMQRLSLIGAVVVGTGGPLLWAGGIERGGVLLAAVAGTFLGTGTSNQLGPDGAARWIHLVVGTDAGSDLRGRNLAYLTVVGPVVVAVTTVLAAVGGEWSLYWLALALAFAGFGVGVGVGNLLTVLVPMKLPETGTNPFATGGGSRSGLSLAAGMGSVVALTVLLAPLVAAAFWSLDHP
ncbi:MAG: hypothetical protein ACRC35_12480, partial [Angustibacter sp.]